MIQIRQLTADDIPLGMRLKSAAGWNQLAADWQRMLALQPRGCFLAEWQGRGVGTAATCVFGRIAWIAMVLVDEAHRGRGIGRVLLERSLEYLEQQGVSTVRLDATPLGQPLYEKLGFATQFTLARFAGRVASATGSASVAATSHGEQIIEPARPADYPELFALDRAVTLTDRSRLLARLFDEHPEELRLVHSDGRLTGFIIARPGSRALQIGPCIAAPEVGKTLLADAVRRHAGEPLCLDVPLENTTICAFAARLGLAQERTLVRMCRGADVFEELSRLCSSSGPELG